jgi:uroporphyrinogen-III synthase
MSQTSILSTKHWLTSKGKYFLMLIWSLEQDFIEIKTTFELKTINNNLIFSSQNAVLSLIEQNGWEV